MGRRDLKAFSFGDGPALADELAALMRLPLIPPSALGEEHRPLHAEMREGIEIYANVPIAEQRGLADDALATIVAGQRPPNLFREEGIVHDVASALVHSGVLPELSYRHTAQFARHCNHAAWEAPAERQMDDPARIHRLAAPTPAESHALPVAHRLRTGGSFDGAPGVRAPAGARRRRAEPPCRIGAVVRGEFVVLKHIGRRDGVTTAPELP